MKAAVLYEVNKPLVIEDVAVRDIGRREVLIRTAAAGLCHSDLHYMEGAYPTPMPIVMGHESAGIVEKVGADVTYVKPGDHVITCVSMFCGTCENCVSGMPSICTDTSIKQPPGERAPYIWDRPTQLSQFTNLGSFAELLPVHENAIVKIRPEMPMDIAAIIGCAIITGYSTVVNAAAIRAGDSVAVIGCGGVGMAAVNTAAIMGAGKVIAIDTNPDKLRLAQELGATDVIDAADCDPVETVKELTRGAGVNHALEMLGLKATAEQSFRMLGAGGTATVAGMIPYGTNIALHGADLLKNRRIQGTSMGSNRFRADIPRIVDYYMRGMLKLDHWISSRIALAEINRGFEDLKAGKVIRTVITFAH